MKKSIKWIIAAAVSVLLFAGVYGLYVFLSNTYALDPFAGNAQSQTNAVDKPSGASSQPAQGKRFQQGRGPGLYRCGCAGRRGKIIRLFWQTHCAEFLGVMVRILHSGNAGFPRSLPEQSRYTVLMVNATDGYQETLESAKSFIEEAGYTFPVLYDTKMEAVSAYGAFGLPMTVFIDKEGKVVAYANGMLSAENLEKGMQMIQ